MLPKSCLQKGRTEEQSLKNRNEEKEIKCSTFFGGEKMKINSYFLNMEMMQWQKQRPISFVQRQTKS